MRRLFPLKPASSSKSNNNTNSHNSNSVPIPDADKNVPYFWEFMVENRGDNLKENSFEVQMGRDSRKKSPRGGDSNWYSPKGRTESSSFDRRSQSSSSSVFSSSSAEKNQSSLSDASKSSPRSVDVPVQGIKCAPIAATANGHGATRGAKICCTNRSTSVPKDRSEANPGMPLHPPRPPLRSNSSRIPKSPNGDFDFCFTGNEENVENPIVGKAHEEEITAENEVVLNSGRRPCFRPSGMVHDANVKGLTRSRSFHTTKGSYSSIGENNSEKLQCEVSSRKCSSSGNSVTDKLSSRYQTARNVAEKLVKSLPGKSKSKATHFEVKNTPDKEALIHGDGRIRKEFLKSLHASAYELGSCDSPGTEQSLLSKIFEGSSSQIQGYKHGGSKEERQLPTGQMGSVEGSSFQVEQKEVDGTQFQIWFEGCQMNNDTDEELEKRAKEAEDQAMLLSKELESLNWYNCTTTGVIGPKNPLDLNVELLRQKFRKNCEEKRKLVLEVSSEIRSRIAERYAANEALKLIKGEIESRGKIMENEKNDLQLSLEKELDKRSSEWATMLEKIKLEERRLRDRVRDLAEQNVALQREVSSLNNREINLTTQVREFEQHIDGYRERLENAENEIIQLRESLSESYKQTKQTEDDRESIKRSCKEKERENHELQKSLVRFQRLCKDQERTIGGFLQGLNDEVNHSPQDTDDRIAKMQREQLRLIGVEQVLRKDLENCRWEADALRRENTSLLERVRSREKGCGFGLIKLDQELRDRLDGLQAQSLSLLDEIILFAAKLLESFKKNIYTIDASESNEGEYSKGQVANEKERNHALDLEMTFQRLGRKVDSLKKSIRVQKEILKEKSHLSCSESLRQDAEDSETWQLQLESPETGDQFGELQQELKAETLLVKVLREKMCSREGDLERLQEEVVTLIRSQELLKNENSDLHEMLICANQKEKDLEFLLEGKDNNIRHLHDDLQECFKELTSLRGELPKVSKERDGIRQNAEQLSWQNMKLRAEVETLKKRIEKLDEDVLLKEGQLSILQESLIT